MSGNGEFRVDLGNASGMLHRGKCLRAPDPSGGVAVRKLGRVVPLFVALVLGCSPSTRDRLKRFFFEVPGDRPEAQVTHHADTEPGDEPPVLKLPRPSYASVHRPVAEGNCARCHDPNLHMQVRADMMDACRACHSRYFSDEVGHDPVAQGACTECHEMHRSKQPFLLTRPMPETCTDCHEEPEDLSEEAHGGEGVANCTRCHDPHFGSGMLLRSDQAAKKTGFQRTTSTRRADGE